MQVACRDVLLISLPHFRQGFFLGLVLVLVVEVGRLHFPVVDLVCVGVLGASAACRFRARELVGEAVLRLGVYPEVSLASARNKTHDARIAIAKGNDPSKERLAEIRSVWNEADSKWYFSVADVVEVLTDSANVRDYIKKMRKREQELNANWGTICPP